MFILYILRKLFQIFLLLFLFSEDNGGKSTKSQFWCKTLSRYWRLKNSIFSDSCISVNYLRSFEQVVLDELVFSLPQVKDYSGTLKSHLQKSKTIIELFLLCWFFNKNQWTFLLDGFIQFSSTPVHGSNFKPKGLCYLFYSYCHKC